MDKFSLFIKNLKDKLFGRKRKQEEKPRPSHHVYKEAAPKSVKPIQPVSPESVPKTIRPIQSVSEEPTLKYEEPVQPVSKDIVTKSEKPTRTAVKPRDPYFVQIGFDFGTSFSKCICRDLMTNRAWVYLSPSSGGEELPFLIPSVVLLKDGMLNHLASCRAQYPSGGLYHVKNALVKLATEQWHDPVLAPYRHAAGQLGADALSHVVENCAVYFLAGTIGTVRKHVRNSLPDFGKHSDDYMAINLAVPVADAERPDVNELFRRLLCEAWILSDALVDYPPIHLNLLGSLRRSYQKKIDQSVEDACFIYPEVSANVQGFVRSRVSSPGMYLFSDTGGGTVDQSVFIFLKNDNSERLVYLAGRVLPLGSSNIERMAAESCGSAESLDVWRERKERGDNNSAIYSAREKISQQLRQETEATLSCTHKKLYLKDQLEEMRIIFGGGGHCKFPYQDAVIRPFSGQLFRRNVKPDLVGLPVPKNLDIKDTEERWMRRLSVAYGLSFERSELARFTYPKDVSNPTPEELSQYRKPAVDAIGKDQC